MASSIAESDRTSIVVQGHFFDSILSSNNVNVHVGDNFNYGVQFSNRSPFSEYADFVKVLGSGMFGSILLVQRRSDEKVLVCKTIQYDEPDDSRPRAAASQLKRKQRIQEECQILMALQHRNIVPYVHHTWEANAEPRPVCNLYMELCEHGDLQGYIRQLRRGQTFPGEIAVWRVVEQLSSALAYCHEGLLVSSTSNIVRLEGWKQILHRDIKPGNVFISGFDSDGKPKVKLGDFGLGAIVTDTRKLTTYAGTTVYLPPEVTRTSPEWSTKSDVFSLGAAMYEYLTLEGPFEDHVKSEADLPDPPAQERCTQALRDLITICLRIVPQERPTALRLLEVSMHALHVFGNGYELHLQDDWIMVDSTDEDSSNLLDS